MLPHQIIIFGSVFAYAAIGLGAYRHMNGVCSVQYFALSISFVLIFGTAYIKTWYVNTPAWVLICCLIN